jgi:hypothetical protein
VTRKGRFVVVESTDHDFSSADTPHSLPQGSEPADHLLNIEGLLLQVLERSQKQERMMQVICGSKKKGEKEDDPAALQAQLVIIAAKVSGLSDKCDALARENANLRAQLNKYTQSAPPPAQHPEWCYDMPVPTNSANAHRTDALSTAGYSTAAYSTAATPNAFSTATNAAQSALNAAQSAPNVAQPTSPNSQPAPNAAQPAPNVVQPTASNPNRLS